MSMRSGDPSNVFESCRVGKRLLVCSRVPNERDASWMVNFVIAGTSGLYRAGTKTCPPYTTLARANGRVAHASAGNPLAPSAADFPHHGTVVNGLGNHAVGGVYGVAVGGGA